MKKFLIWAGIGLVLLLLSPSFGVWYVIISAIVWGSTGLPDEARSSGRTFKDDSEDSYKKKHTPFRDERGVYEVYTSAGITHYSDGSRSYTDVLGNKHFDNGVVDCDTLRGDKEYYKDGEYLGSSYTDDFGVTHYYR